MRRVQDGPPRQSFLPRLRLVSRAVVVLACLVALAAVVRWWLLRPISDTEFRFDAPEQVLRWSRGTRLARQLVGAGKERWVLSGAYRAAEVREGALEIEGVGARSFLDAPSGLAVDFGGPLACRFELAVELAPVAAAVSIDYEDGVSDAQRIAIPPNIMPATFTLSLRPGVPVREVRITPNPAGVLLEGGGVMLAGGGVSQRYEPKDWWTYVGEGASLVVRFGTQETGKADWLLAAPDWSRGFDRLLLGLAIATPREGWIFYGEGLRRQAGFDLFPQAGFHTYTVPLADVRALRQCRLIGSRVPARLRLRSVAFVPDDGFPSAVRRDWLFPVDRSQWLVANDLVGTGTREDAALYRTVGRRPELRKLIALPAEEVKAVRLRMAVRPLPVEARVAVDGKLDSSTETVLLPRNSRATSIELPLRSDAGAFQGITLIADAPGSYLLLEEAHYRSPDGEVTPLLDGPRYLRYAERELERAVLPSASAEAPDATAVFTASPDLQRDGAVVLRLGLYGETTGRIVWGEGAQERQDFLVHADGEMDEYVVPAGAPRDGWLRLLPADAPGELAVGRIAVSATAAESVPEAERVRFEFPRDRFHWIASGDLLPSTDAPEHWRVMGTNPALDRTVVPGAGQSLEYVLLDMAVGPLPVPGRLRLGDQEVAFEMPRGLELETVRLRIARAMPAPRTLTLSFEAPESRLLIQEAVLERNGERRALLGRPFYQSLDTEKLAGLRLVGRAPFPEDAVRLDGWPDQLIEGDVLTVTLSLRGPLQGRLVWGGALDHQQEFDIAADGGRHAYLIRLVPPIESPALLRLVPANQAAQLTLHAVELHPEPIERPDLRITDPMNPKRSWDFPWDEHQWWLCEDIVPEQAGSNASVLVSRRRDMYLTRQIQAKGKPEVHSASVRMAVHPLPLAASLHAGNARRDFEIRHDEGRRTLRIEAEGSVSEGLVLALPDAPDVYLALWHVRHLRAGREPQELTQPQYLRILAGRGEAVHFVPPGGLSEAAVIVPLTDWPGEVLPGDVFELDLEFRGPVTLQVKWGYLFANGKSMTARADGQMHTYSCRLAPPIRFDELLRFFLSSWPARVELERISLESLWPPAAETEQMADPTQERTVWRFPEDEFDWQPTQGLLPLGRYGAGTGFESAQLRPLLDRTIEGAPPPGPQVLVLRYATEALPVAGRFSVGQDTAHFEVRLADPWPTETWLTVTAPCPADATWALSFDPGPLSIGVEAVSVVSGGRYAELLEQTHYAWLSSPDVPQLLLSAPTETAPVLHSVPALSPGDLVRIRFRLRGTARGEVRWGADYAQEHRFTVIADGAVHEYTVLLSPPIAPGEPLRIVPLMGKGILSLQTIELHDASAREEPLPPPGDSVFPRDEHAWRYSHRLVPITAREDGLLMHTGGVDGWLERQLGVCGEGKQVVRVSYSITPEPLVVTAVLGGVSPEIRLPLRPAQVESDLFVSPPVPESASPEFLTLDFPTRGGAAVVEELWFEDSRGDRSSVDAPALPVHVYPHTPLSLTLAAGACSAPGDATVAVPALPPLRAGGRVCVRARAATWPSGRIWWSDDPSQSAEFPVVCNGTRQEAVVEIGPVEQEHFALRLAPCEQRGQVCLHSIRVGTDTVDLQGLCPALPQALAAGRREQRPSGLPLPISLLAESGAISAEAIGALAVEASVAGETTPEVTLLFHEWSDPEGLPVCLGAREVIGDMQLHSVVLPATGEARKVRRVAVSAPEFPVFLQVASAWYETETGQRTTLVGPQAMVPLRWRGQLTLDRMVAPGEVVLLPLAVSVAPEGRYGFEIALFPDRRAVLTWRSANDPGRQYRAALGSSPFRGEGARQHIELSQLHGWRGKILEATFDPWPLFRAVDVAELAWTEGGQPGRQWDLASAMEPDFEIHGALAALRPTRPGFEVASDLGGAALSFYPGLECAQGAVVEARYWVGPIPVRVDLVCGTSAVRPLRLEALPAQSPRDFRLPIAGEALEDATLEAVVLRFGLRDGRLDLHEVALETDDGETIGLDLPRAVFHWADTAQIRLAWRREADLAAGGRRVDDFFRLNVPARRLRALHVRLRLLDTDRPELRVKTIGPAGEQWRRFPLDGFTRDRWHVTRIEVPPTEGELHYLSLAPMESPGTLRLSDLRIYPPSGDEGGAP